MRIEVTFTTSICVAGTVTATTVEAVIMVSIAGLVKPSTIWMILTDINDTLSSLTFIPSIAVSVISTLASVVSQVTDWGGVLAVEVSIGASC